MRHLSDYHVVWAGVKSKISDSQKSVFLSAPTSPSPFFSILSFDEVFLTVFCYRFQKLEMIKCCFNFF